MVDADIAIAGRAGAHTVDHIEWTDFCIHIQVLVAAPDIAVLLEDTEADTCKLTAVFGKRAVALPSAPESGPELLVPVDSGLRRGLGGRMADFGQSLYTAYRGRLGVAVCFFQRIDEIYTFHARMPVLFIRRVLLAITIWIMRPPWCK